MGHFASRITITQIQEALLPDVIDLPQITDVTFDVVYEAAPDAESFRRRLVQGPDVAKFAKNGDRGGQL